VTAFEDVRSPEQRMRDVGGKTQGFPPPNSEGSGLFQGNPLDDIFVISDEPWDPLALPPRPWLAPPYLMRGEITLPHGPGAAGKSQLIIAWFVALALNKPFGRLRPRQRSRVLLFNFEDTAVEQKRRISAALRRFDATEADLRGWLYRVTLGPRSNATMFELDPRGAVHTTDTWHAVERGCEQLKPDAIALDPFIAINAVPESDNQLMRRVMTIMRLFAEDRGLALALAHHDAKNGNGDEDADQTIARGAGDIINAIRFELAVRKMTVQQAKDFGVEPDRRGMYFRVGSVASKINYAAPQPPEWFERIDEVFNREAVVSCAPWTPPTGNLTEEIANKIIAEIGRGTKSGSPYSPQLGNSDRSLGPALADLGITGSKPQRRAMDELTLRHGVVNAAWRLPGRGDVTRKGLRTAGGRPDTVEWVEQDREDDA
jgi:hypothetical protein